MQHVEMKGQSSKHTENKESRDAIVSSIIASSPRLCKADLQHAAYVLQDTHGHTVHFALELRLVGKGHAHEALYVISDTKRCA